VTTAQQRIFLSGTHVNVRRALVALSRLSRRFFTAPREFARGIEKRRWKHGS
jgi:hypothetical protein